MSETRLSHAEIEALRDEHREEKWSIDRDGLPAQLDSECFACGEPWPCDVARLLATYDDILLAWQVAAMEKSQ